MTLKMTKRPRIFSLTLSLCMAAAMSLTVGFVRTGNDRSDHRAHNGPLRCINSRSGGNGEKRTDPGNVALDFKRRRFVYSPSTFAGTI